MTTGARRSVTLPLYLVGAAATPFLLATLPLAGLFDLARRTDWATTRAILFVAFYFVCEAVGLVAAALLWCYYKLNPAMTRDDYLAANFRLQCAWARALFAGVERIFRVATEVSGDAAVAAGGPILVFARHASTGDTLLPAVLISARHGVVLRYVLKKELLWDPCLDVVGQRLRNYFVDRGSADSGREIEEVARLSDQLGEREGVLIFPEGTRFSAAKRERALRDLETRGEGGLLEKARSMHHVLPPKLGGPIALLQRNLRADLVLLAHTGFEGVERMTDLVDGSLIGRVIKVRFWRFSRGDIPTDPQALRLWLFDAWKSVDEWIDQVRAGAAAAQVKSCRP